MKIVFSAFLLLVCMSANVYAVTCRSGEAAVRGSQSGYEEDKKAAEQIVENELSFSDILEKCVGGVTGIKAGPTYGSSETFGGWAEKILKQVCSIARDKINNTVDGTAESRMGSALQNIYTGYEQGQISGTSGTQSGSSVITNLSSTVTPSTIQSVENAISPSDSSSASDGSAFWNDIWK